MYSADGIQWARYPAPICDILADSQYSGFWDASLYGFQFTHAPEPSSFILLAIGLALAYACRRRTVR
jgi:hypothetical protein